MLAKARELLLERADEFANLIRMESGLCMRETKYEVGRACDVFQFAAAEAFKGRRRDILRRCVAER